VGDVCDPSYTLLAKVDERYLGFGVGVRGHTRGCLRRATNRYMSLVFHASMDVAYAQAEAGAGGRAVGGAGAGVGGRW
jgi:hypothetical protein